MHLVVFEKGDLPLFARHQALFDETGIHHNIKKILKCIPHTDSKYHAESFVSNLKRYLQNYRICVINILTDELATKCILIMQISNDFPYQSLLAKRNIDIQKDLIKTHNDEIWAFIELLEDKMEQAQPTSNNERNSESIGNQDGGTCSTVTKCFSSCCPSLFYTPKRDGYVLVDEQVDDISEHQPQQKNFAYH